MDYLDFEISVEADADGAHRAKVIRSPGGEAEDAFRLPFAGVALELQLQKIENVVLRSGQGRRRLSTADEQVVQAFGHALFEALLPPGLRARYRVSQRDAHGQEKGLRLKLRIQDPALASLPWELLYDADEGDFVCLSSSTPLVRYFQLPRSLRPLRVKRPLRVLGMVASPADLARLDVESEMERVKRAVDQLVRDGVIEWTWLEGANWRGLQRAMRSDWHVFHFVGHGGFERAADEGVVALVGDDGKSQSMRASELARLLVGRGSLRLVVLNACEGARSGGQDLFSSTASILVQHGIPAVLAMQHEVSDRVAIEIARSFYEALADGDPVDAATAEARKAVSVAVPGTFEWCTPVLFLRAPDGVLFELPSRSPSTAASERHQPATEHAADPEPRPAPEPGAAEPTGSATGASASAAAPPQARAPFGIRLVKKGYFGALFAVGAHTIEVRTLNPIMHTVLYDGREVSKRMTLMGVTHEFSLVEDGEPAAYQLTAKGSSEATSHGWYCVIVRNGAVVYSDRKSSGSGRDAAQA